MSAGAAGAAGAAAAAAAARRRREEEEAMTPYATTDLAEGWEFKILRSATAAFKNPERLRQALAEEAAAGWVLVEKFDNSRLRLKRPASAAAGDASLGFDAYRTSVGMSEGRLAAAILCTVFVTIAVVITIIVIATRGYGP